MISPAVVGKVRGKGLEGADIIPLDGQRHGNDMAPGSTRRDRLHDGEVHRDLLHLGIDLLQGLWLTHELTRLTGSGRFELGDDVEQSRGPPDEHSGVPPELPGIEVAARQLRIGLLDEFTHLEGAAILVNGVATMQVPETGVRLGGNDTERHQGRGIGLGDLEAVVQGGAKSTHWADDVIGGDGGNDGVRVGVGDDGSRPRHGVEGIPPHGFPEDVAARHLGKDVGDDVGIGLPGAHEDVLVRDDTAHPFEGHSQQTHPVDEVEQLLGFTLA